MFLLTSIIKDYTCEVDSDGVSGIRLVEARMWESLKERELDLVS